MNHIMSDMGPLQVSHTRDCPIIIPILLPFFNLTCPVHVAYPVPYPILTHFIPGTQFFIHYSNQGSLETRICRVYYFTLLKYKKLIKRHFLYISKQPCFVKKLAPRSTLWSRDSLSNTPLIFSPKFIHSRLTCPYVLFCTFVYLTLSKVSLNWDETETLNALKILGM